MHEDRKIIYESMFNEYNNKFVYPRVFVRTADKAIGTEDLQLSNK